MDCSGASNCLFNNPASSIQQKNPRRIVVLTDRIKFSNGSYMKLTEVSIQRPAFITMVFVALATLGMFAYMQMGVDLLPKMDWPMVSVVTVYPGAGPKEVEFAVSKPIEETLSSLNGLKHIRSFSNE